MSQMKYLWIAAALLAALVVTPSPAEARRPVRFAARRAVRTAVVVTPPYGRVYAAPAAVYVAPRVYVAPSYGPHVIYGHPVVYVP